MASSTKPSLRDVCDDTEWMWRQSQAGAKWVGEYGVRKLILYGLVNTPDESGHVLCSGGPWQVACSII